MQITHYTNYNRPTTSKLNLDALDSINFNIEDAIKSVETEINNSLRDFNTWMAQNPILATKDNPIYLDKRQNIKFLRLKLNELVEMQKDYIKNQQPRFRIARELRDVDRPQFTRNSLEPVNDKPQNKLGMRTFNKLSRR